MRAGPVCMNRLPVMPYVTLYLTSYGTRTE
jgi:hypothetical protein